MTRTPVNKPRTGTPYAISALAKGLRVLSVFSEQRRELRLTEIAKITGIPVPTVFRLLKTLEADGYVDQLDDARFRPGPYVLSLGYAALQGLDIVQAATLPLRQLADQTAETVNLGILAGTNVLYLIRLKNRDLVTADLQVGSMLPAACSSLGKLLLAYLESDELETRLRAVDFSECRGPRAARSITQLNRQLKETREHGWAIQDEEVAHGLRSIAAPIYDRTGSVSAAANVAVQASRWTRDELIHSFLTPLLAATTEISRRLGHVPMAAAADS